MKMSVRIDNRTRATDKGGKEIEIVEIWDGQDRMNWGGGVTGIVEGDGGFGGCSGGIAGS